MESTRLIVLILVMAEAFIHMTTASATVHLGQEDPCFQGQNCTLNCSTLTGSKTFGYNFVKDGTTMISCTNPTSCSSILPSVFVSNVVDNFTSTVTLISFNPVSMGGQWHCQDGSSGSASNTFQVTANVAPSGAVEFPDNCVGADSFTVNCSLNNLGNPPAMLIFSDTSGLLINQTSSPVDYSLTVSGNVTCSVQWTAFPNYNHGVGSVSRTCSITAPTTTGCNCTCPCHCRTVKGLVCTLAVVTAALLVCIIVICCCQGGKWDQGKGCMKLVMKCVTIILMVVAVAFIIAVGVYTLSNERKCNGTDSECYEKSCCQDTYCPEAYKASIAFVVIGSVVVITAIIVLMRPSCCFSPRPPVPLQATTGGAGGDMEIPTKPSAPLSTLSNNGNPNTPSKPSPGRRLPPLESPTEKTGNVTEQAGLEKTKKKKKSKKDQPEWTEERPLPTPKQDENAPKTQRRTSMDAPVNMSGSNNSPLPMRSNFTPGNPASGQSEGVMPPVGSSSLKR